MGRFTRGWRVEIGPVFDIDLPSLQFIHLGPFSLCGIDYQRKNELVLKSCHVINI